MLKAPSDHKMKGRAREAFMCVWQHALRGSEGDLVSVHVKVEPRHLEDLLEALAEVPFPVNPEIHHHPRLTTVEFPAYAAQLPAAEQVLANHGFVDCLRVVNMLEEIQPH